MYVGLDIGSQFFKLGHSREDGTVAIFRNQVMNSVLNPSAVSIKFTHPHKLPLTASAFEDIKVRFGGAALSLLRQNASLDFKYLPQTVGRFGPSEFKTGTVTSELELFALMVFNALRPVPPFNAVAVSVPSYWTCEQLFAITDSCKVFEIPLVGTVTDVQAVVTLYGRSKLARISKAQCHVLFVDVGAALTKVYSTIFAYNNTSPTHDFVDAHQALTEWSENIGGYHFAKAIAAAKNISIRKAPGETEGMKEQGRPAIKDL
jgi:hypothetical protein